MEKTRVSSKRAGSKRAAAGQRLDPAVRRQQILDAAIAYFAEAGLAVQTRELTRRIGVSQPLLYRYFPSKQALIDAVFEAVFLNVWDDALLAPLLDRKQPLEQRLFTFYRDYISATYRPEWLRIYLFAGLADYGFNRDYMSSVVEQRILTRLCTELRAAFVPPRLSRRVPGIHPREIELAWMLQSSAFYWVMRRTVFHVEPMLDFDTRFRDAIDLFVAGARHGYPRMLEAIASETKPPRRKTSGGASSHS